MIQCPHLEPTHNVCRFLVTRIEKIPLVTERFCTLRCKKLGGPYMGRAIADRSASEFAQSYLADHETGKLLPVSRIHLPQLEDVRRRIAANRSACESCSENDGFVSEGTKSFENLSRCNAVCTCPVKIVSMEKGTCPKNPPMFVGGNPNPAVNIAKESNAEQAEPH